MCETLNNHLRIKNALEAFYEGVFHVGNREMSSSDFVLHGGHTEAVEAAGNDRLEPAKVGADVEGETMRGNAAADTDAYRCDLAVADPDAGASRRPLCHDTEAVKGAYQHFFEAAHVLARAEAAALQVENWIPDDLAGAVEGDVAATVGLDDVGAAPLELVRRDKKVLRADAAAEGVHRWVLYKHEGIVSTTTYRGGHSFLLLPGLPVAKLPPSQEMYPIAQKDAFYSL
jgi:hypothetical protein